MNRRPCVAHVGQVGEEVVAEGTDPIREHTVLRSVVVGAEDTHATHEHGHLRGGQAHECGTVEHQLFGADDVVLLEPVAATVMDGLGSPEYGSAVRRAGIGTPRSPAR